MFKKYELVGFFFTSILGCLLHFVYEWTGENIIAAIFSATDESTFQHLKLFFFPYLLWIFVEQRKFGSIAKNLLPAKANRRDLRYDFDRSLVLRLHGYSGN